MKISLLPLAGDFRKEGLGRRLGVRSARECISEFRVLFITEIHNIYTQDFSA